MFRIDYRKGLDSILLPALSQLKGNSLPLKLVIAGSDSDGYIRRVQLWIHDH